MIYVNRIDGKICTAMIFYLVVAHAWDFCGRIDGLVKAQMYADKDFLTA